MRPNDPMSKAPDAGEDSIGYRLQDSASWRISDLPRHRRGVTIVHRPLTRLTPADLVWWFTHIDGPAVWMAAR